MYKKIGVGNFKTRLQCRMCKERFTLEKELWKKKFWPKSYCSNCCKKYFNKKKKD